MRGAKSACLPEASNGSFLSEQTSIIRLAAGRCRERKSRKFSCEDEGQISKNPFECPRQHARHYLKIVTWKCPKDSSRAVLWASLVGNVNEEGFDKAWSSNLFNSCGSHNPCRRFRFAPSLHRLIARTLKCRLSRQRKCGALDTTSNTDWSPEKRFQKPRLSLAVRTLLRESINPNVPYKIYDRFLLIERIAVRWA